MHVSHVDGITSCVYKNLLESIHLLRQVVAQQAVEAAQMGLSSEVEPHHLVQVPDESCRQVSSYPLACFLTI